MAIGCALSWALAVLAFRAVRGVDPAALNLFKTSIAAVLLALTMLAMQLPFARDRALADWAALALSGVLGLAVADTFFLAGLARVDASVAAIADCAYSPTVLLLAGTFLGEPMGASLLLGGGLVVTGLGVIAYEPRATAKPIDRRGLLLCVAGVVTTAIAVVIARPVLDRSELVEATAVRLIAGASALLIVQVLMRRTTVALSLFRPQPAWRPAITGTLLGTYVAMILWLGGMKYGTASRAALLNQSGAIFVLVFSRMAGEPIPPRRWIGAAIALAGVAVVVAG